MRNHAPPLLRQLYAIFWKPRLVRYALLLGSLLAVTVHYSESFGKEAFFKRKVVSIETENIVNFTLKIDENPEVLFTKSESSPHWLGVRHALVVKFPLDSLTNFFKIFNHIEAFNQVTEKIFATLQPATSEVQLALKMSNAPSKAEKIAIKIVENQGGKFVTRSFSLHRVASGVFLKLPTYRNYYQIESDIFDVLNQDFNYSWNCAFLDAQSNL